MRKLQKIMVATIIAISMVSIKADEDIDKLIIKFKDLENKFEDLKKKQEERNGNSNIKLGKLVESLNIKGDLRLRYERFDQDDETDPTEERKDRFRYRLRLGAKWQTENDFTIGTRFAIGGGTSTNETMSNQANPNLGVDRVYIQYTGFENLKLTAGRMPNPFEKNEMIWDGDLNPEGASAQLEIGVLFVNAAAIVIDNDGWNDDASGDNANIFGVQAGIKTEGPVSLKIGGGYIAPSSQTQEDEIGGSVDYEISMVETFADIAIKTGDKGKVNFFGKLVKNIDANDKGPTQIAYANVNEKADDNNIGWEAGIGFKQDKFSLKYTYRHLEGDSVWNAINDGDFGDNRKGHIIGAKYKVAKNFTVGLKYFNKEELEETTLNKDIQEEIYQLDLVWKF